MAPHALTPYISVQNTDSAIAFYKAAFGAVEIGPRIVMPDGKIGHHEIEILGSLVMLADEMPEFGNLGPLTLGGTTVRFNLQTDNVDALFSKAVDAGAKAILSPTDQFYGYRDARIEDPYGHEWLLSQKMEEVPFDEMQRRCDQAYGQS